MSKTQSAVSQGLLRQLRGQKGLPAELHSGEQLQNPEQKHRLVTDLTRSSETIEGAKGTPSRTAFRWKPRAKTLPGHGPEHWNSWAKHNECSLTRSSETIEGGKRDSSRTAFRWTTKQKQNNQCIGWFGVTVFSVGITLSYLSKFIWFPSLFYNRTILNWNKVQSRDYPFKNTAPTFSDS